MGLRATVSTAMIRYSRLFGRILGCELAVDAGGQTLDVQMVTPSTDGERAWDDTMYVRGNLFVDGYANPVKPQVRTNAELGDSDEVDVEVSEQASEDPENVSMMSSARYRLFMVQDLVSELLNPKERLDKILYGIIAVGAVLLINLLSTLFVLYTIS